MAVSQNGFTANDSALCSRRQVPGTSVGLTVRKGVFGEILLEVASLFDRLVQDIDNARGLFNPTGELDDWGYAERPIRGATTLSNHASGTAIDLNATRWSLGQSASVNLNARQIATVRSIVAATNSVVRWGGDYSGRKDPMHFELNRCTEAQAQAALDNLRKTFTTSKGSDAEMNTEERKMFDQMHRALTLVLPLSGRPGSTTDDMYGHVLSTDATARSILAKLDSIDKRLTALESKTK